MLRWNEGLLKLTLGFGSLGLAVMLSHWKDSLSTFGVVVLAMGPFLTFLMVRPGEQSDRTVRTAQVWASCGYLGMAAILLVVWRPPFANQTIAYAMVFAGGDPVRSRPPVGLVRWGEMSGIALGKMGLSHRLTIAVRDPETVLARAGAIAWFNARISSLLGQGPVSILLYPVDGSADAIWASIESTNRGVGATIEG